MDDIDLISLKKEIGTSEFDKLTEEQNAKIYKKIADKELSSKELAKIISIAPAFTNGFINTINVMVKAISESNESQKNALEALKIADAFIEPLNILAQGCSSAEERIAIAETIQNVVFKISDTTKEIQKEHTQNLKNIGGTIVALLLIGGLICLGSSSNSGSSS